MARQTDQNMDHQTSQIAETVIGHHETEIAAPAHAPTLWKFVPWHVEEGPSAVRSPAGDIVCTTASDADAQLIEKAVNNHNEAMAFLALASKSLWNLGDQAVAHEIDRFLGRVGGARDALSRITAAR